MKLLLLSYFFPPDPEVGGIRPAKIARSFVEAGAEVHVVSAGKLGSQPETLTTGGVKVHRVVPWRSLRDWVQYLSASDAKEPKSNGSGHLAPNLTLPHWSQRSPLLAEVRRSLNSVMWLPDDRHGYIPAAVQAAVDIIHNRQIDVVYASGPPFSTHLAGWLVKRLTGKPLIMEYRDPWVDTRKNDEFQTPWSLALERWLRARTQSAGDAFVAVTGGIADVVRGQSGAGRPVIAAWNGIETLPPPEPLHPAKPFTLVHAGELYLGRDPGPVLRAIAELKGPLGLSASTFRLLLLGQGTTYRGVSVPGLTRDLGIEDLVVFQDTIPFEQCQALLRRSHALLLLAMDQPTQVPNKLFDYLAARRPILGFVDPEGESHRILRDFSRHHLVVDRQQPAATQALAALIQSHQNGHQRPDDDSQLRNFLWDTQFPSVYRLARELIEAGAPGASG